MSYIPDVHMFGAILVEYYGATEDVLLLFDWKTLLSKTAFRLNHKK